MKQIIKFLSDLSQNNNRPWFEEHKQEYKQARASFDVFSLKFIEAVEKFDPSMQGLTLKDCSFRIYQDMRFSRDKLPYHAYFGVYVCRGGRNSGNAGYYIHVQPETNNFGLCAGIYNPTPAVVKSIRDEIMLNGKEFEESLSLCPDFSLPWDNALKKAPRGYSPDDEYARYYLLRSYDIYKSLELNDVLAPHFLDFAIENLERTFTYNKLLNRCVDYAAQNF